MDKTLYKKKGCFLKKIKLVFSFVIIIQINQNL